MGIFKRFRQWCRSRKQLKKLHDIGSVFHVLDKMEQGGMITFDTRNRRLFIEEPLALVMMAGGAERWANFIQNCFTWLYHRQCAEAWSEYMRKEELDAVRVAANKFTAMTRADIERVRRQRRDEINQGDMEPPKVEPFEFFVVRAAKAARASTSPASAEPKHTEKDGRSDTATNKTAVPAGEILAVGHYDPDTEQLELGTWEEVSLYLNREDKTKKGDRHGIH